MNDSIKLLIAEWYVNDLKDLGKTIDTYEYEIERLRARADGLKSVSGNDKVTASSDVHKLENITNDLMDKIKAYAVELEAYITRSNQAHSYFTQLPKTQCNALILHYLSGKTWEETCVILNYSYPRIMQIRKEGIISLYDILPYSTREEIRKQVMPSSI